MWLIRVSNLTFVYEGSYDAVFEKSASGSRSFC